MKLSALVVAHNEEVNLPDCLAALASADEVVVVLDKCTDKSREIALSMGAKIVEGAWELEGARRNTGIDACSGDWILEVDADERVPAALLAEIRQTIATAAPGSFLIPFDNYIGGKLVRYGWGASWGVSQSPRLFARGHKRWGPQRVHPALELTGVTDRKLKTAIDHLVDTDISDMIRRFDRYTTARAEDMVENNKVESTKHNVRRIFSRFYKCYVTRKGYREGMYGLLNGIFAGLFPLFSHLKAEEIRQKQRS